MSCVVLGVTAGIAAYKAVEVARQLVSRGITVKVIMTERARNLVGPSTFRAITGNPVAISLFDDPESPMKHISLAREADVVVVAPATANLLAKMAHGLADDLLSTTLLATRAPVVVAPAMNAAMFRHPATQENLEKLRQRGVVVVGPEEGYLACGEEGEGRMSEPSSIVDAVLALLRGGRQLEGKKVLVTAGGTREPFDPVRYVGNRSSGKMGFALAEVAKRKGAEVYLVSAPASLAPPEGVTLIRVETAEEMRDEVMKLAPDVDVVVMAAAVADYTPEGFSEEKIKKDGQEELVIRLRRTPDILKELLENRKRDQIIVGFAAETGNLREKALSKIESKRVDLLVANDVTRPGCGFGSDYNQALLVFPDGRTKETDLMPKEDLAMLIWDEVARLLAEKA
ncbi:MAG: bifunctional phosphopantothenoylcysteine decarboxylase/phosphopantothenate--cysteine ligase CoaBC [Candidatus Geothermincolales bacterium]